MFNVLREIFQQKLQHTTIPMKKIILLFALGLILLSCNKDNEYPVAACGVSNPVNELPWIKARIAEMETSSLRELFYVAQSELNGQTLFIFGNCCAQCNSVMPVYNYAGEELGLIGAQDGKYGTELLSGSSIIWKTENNNCLLE